MLNLRKYGEVEISEDVVVPVKTLSIGEEAAIKFPLPDKMPTKIEVLSESDKKILQEKDKGYKPDIYIATKVLDTTSEAYKQYAEKVAKLTPILDGVKYIHFLKTIQTPEGEMPYHKTIGIENPRDWFEVCEKFEEAGLNDNHIEKIILKVNSLKGDSISARLYNLQEITKLDYFTLLTALDSFLSKRVADGEKANDILKKIDAMTDEQLSKLAIKENTGE